MYIYKDPLKEGAKKVKIKSKDHNKLWPYNKAKWYNHYDYYLYENKLVIHKTTSVLAWLLNVVCLPFLIVYETLIECKNIPSYIHDMIFQKKAGKFSEDVIWQKSKVWPELQELLSKNK